MPPKGSRGGRGGRGRGRGRGKATGANTTPLPTPNLDDPESQSTQTLNSSPPPSPSKITTPNPKDTDGIEDEDEDVEMNLSPNSSPATVPTETPAPTPVRAPLSRQDSANNGGMAGRSSRLSSSALGEARGSAAVGVGGGARGGGATVGTGLGGRGRGSQKESKFKPRNIRRDAGEREKADKEEKARLAAIAAAAARAEARGRGRGVRGGRGRGDVMGRGLGLGRGSGSSVANGLFGIAPAASDRRPGSFVPASATKREVGISRSGGGGASGAGQSSAPSKSRIKIEGSSFARGANNILEGYTVEEDHKQLFREPQYPDEDSSTPRVDIEHINLVSSSEDDTPIITSTNRINKGKSIAYSKGGLKPVRLHREEHKERVSQVNTESSTKLPADAEDSDEEMIAIDEQRSSRIPPPEPKPWKGVYQDTTHVHVKTEPGFSNPSEPGLSFAMHSRSMSRDQTPAVPPSAIAPRSPEFKHSAKELAPKVGPESPKQTKRPPRPRKKRDRKPVIQTEEDRAEYERHLEDVAILANELGGLQTRVRDPEGDVAMDGDGDIEVDKKEGRLYLFQFPPVLPRLYNPFNPKEQPPEEGAVEMTGSSAHMDLTKEKESGTKIKVEEEVIIKKEEVEGDGKEKEVRPVRKVVVDEEGFIGKLIVRESGKVELSWGGTSMVLGRGVDTGFLSMGVVVDGENGGVMDKEGEGKAMGMGKIMGKFVVVPDWEKMS